LYEKIVLLAERKKKKDIKNGQLRLYSEKNIVLRGRAEQKEDEIKKKHRVFFLEPVDV